MLNYFYDFIKFITFITTYGQDEIRFDDGELDSYSAQNLEKLSIANQGLRIIAGKVNYKLVEGTIRDLGEENILDFAFVDPDTPMIETDEVKIVGF